MSFDYMSRTKRQSKRLLLCRDPHGVAARQLVALHRTLRVAGKDTTKNPNRQAIRIFFSTEGQGTEGGQKGQGDRRTGGLLTRTGVRAWVC